MRRGTLFLKDYTIISAEMYGTGTPTFRDHVVRIKKGNFAFCTVRSTCSVAMALPVAVAPCLLVVVLAASVSVRAHIGSGGKTIILPLCVLAS